MGHHLGEIPHIDQRTADGTFAEMIGLGLYDGRQHRDRALFFDHLVANAEPSGSFSLNHSSASSGVANTLSWSTSPTTLFVHVNPNGRHWPPADKDAVILLLPLPETASGRARSVGRGRAPSPHCL